MLDNICQQSKPHAYDTYFLARKTKQTLVENLSCTVLALGRQKPIRIMTSHCDGIQQWIAWQLQLSIDISNFCRCITFQLRGFRVKCAFPCKIFIRPCMMKWDFIPDKTNLLLPICTSRGTTYQALYISMS